MEKTQHTTHQEKQLMRSPMCYVGAVINIALFKSPSSHEHVLYTDFGPLQSIIVNYDPLYIILL